MSIVRVILLLVLIHTSALAQEVNLSAISTRLESLYNLYFPPLTLANVYDREVLPQNIYDALTLEEKVWYALSHTEHFTQSCSLGKSTSVTITERTKKELFGYLPTYWEDGLSSRQREAIEHYPDVCFYVLRAHAKNSNGLPLKYLGIIARNNIWGMIPYLITYYSVDKDCAYLSTLMALMKNGGYNQFVGSRIDVLVYSISNPLREGIQPSEENIRNILELSQQYYEYRKNAAPPLLGIKFVTVDAGHYEVADDSRHGELKSIDLTGFDLSTTEITNALFDTFVKATGYITEAERYKNALVFYPGLDEFQWAEDTTAYWRYPNGISRGGIENKMNHPVTCICFNDAVAFCTWAHVRLPFKDEWEAACRAGTKTKYFWGDDPSKITEYANIWHGKDHRVVAKNEDALYTAPVASYKPNPLGFYDMYGNVFEFCLGEPPVKSNEPLVVSRGGSWWCSSSSCNYFNSEDVGKINPHASFSNNGFRVARSNK